MPWRILRAILTVIAMLAVIVLSVMAALADLSDGSRSAVALALAITTTTLYLLTRPVAKPSPVQAATRSQIARQTGRVLARLIWFIQALLVGVFAYLVATKLDQPGFHGSAAVLAVTLRLLGLLLLGALDLAGFRIDWRFLHGRSAVRFALNTLVAAVMAGYAHTLVKGAEAIVIWVPVHTFRQLADWGFGTVLAVLGTVPVALLYLMSLFVVGIGLKYLAFKALGHDNVVSAWLDDNLPITVERTDGDILIEPDFPVDHGWMGEYR